MADSKDWIVRYYASHDDIPEGQYDGHLVRELVYCKDCKHWGGEYADNECSLLTRMAYPKFWIATQQDDFCSSAERKTDNG